MLAGDFVRWRRTRLARRPPSGAGGARPGRGLRRPRSLALPRAGAASSGVARPRLSGGCRCRRGRPRRPAQDVPAYLLAFVANLVSAAVRARARGTDRRPARHGGTRCRSSPRLPPLPPATPLDDLGGCAFLVDLAPCVTKPSTRGCSAHDTHPPRSAARRHRRPGRLRQDRADGGAVQALPRRYDIGAITNDIYTKEDAAPPDRRRRAAA